jgi:hypothetical protein
LQKVKTPRFFPQFSSPCPLPERAEVELRHSSFLLEYPDQESNEPQTPRGKQGFATQGGTESGTPTDAGQLDALAAELLKLSLADRAWLAALLLGEEMTPPCPPKP